MCTTTYIYIYMYMTLYHPTVPHTLDVCVCRQDILWPSHHRQHLFLQHCFRNMLFNVAGSYSSNIWYQSPLTRMVENQFPAAYAA